MDNNSYEQEFIKSIKQPKQPVPTPRPALKPNSDASTLPLIVSIILGIVVLVESVALIIFAINYGEVLDLYGENNSTSSGEATNDSPEALSENSNFTYDEDYNVISFDLTCTAEDGSKYAFTKAGTYQKTDGSSNSVDSGSYSVINSGAVVLKSSNQTNDKTVYYDGYDIIEGITFYTCGE